MTFTEMRLIATCAAIANGNSLPTSIRIADAALEMLGITPPAAADSEETKGGAS